MNHTRSVLMRILSFLLLLSMSATVFTACKKKVGNGNNDSMADDENEPTIKGDDVVYTSSDYVKKYADTDAMQMWLKENILESLLPPVTFTVKGKSSSNYSWKKTSQKAEKVVYFPQEENPSESTQQIINYDCKELALRVECTLITYTDYPVVEYTAVLYNEASGNSQRIGNLLAADYSIENKTGDYYLHTNRGANTAYNDFEPLSYELSNQKSFAVTNGKPTSTYIPYFNLENKMENTGTIAILNWQGNWKADFTKTESGVTLQAGQHTTDLVLQKGESMDFPGMVLLFYKGDRMNGQNVYRRWLYSCNQFREQGKHMKETNVLVCPPEYTIQADMKNLSMYARTGLLEYIDKYNIDGGWYDTEGNTWFHTGNWFTLKNAYPGGIQQLSQIVHSSGLQFAVWLEPERVAWGTQTTEALKNMGGLIVVGSDGKSVTDYAKVAKGDCYVLLDYSNPKVVQWVINLLNTQFKNNNIDQYRQDFNMYPGGHWTALDKTRAGQLGIPRTGYTENKYCRGYLDVYAGILAENPTMYIDACASGGMRNDLSTIRYSFMHTRSDYWADIESAQLQTYGSSMWFMYWGTGFSSADLNSYDVRSHISNSIGVGISNDSQAQALKNALTDWKHLAGYLFWDYYPLTDYIGATKQTMSLQYDSPEAGKGMFITYFRKNDTITVCPRGLDPKAIYQVWDLDRKESTLRTMTGAQLMAGISITSAAETAIVYEYQLVLGQDTTAFQTENVPTGKGWGGYDPDAKNGKIVNVAVPSVTVPYVNVMADDILVKEYAITEDGQIRYLHSDHRTTGMVYAISANIYDELIYTTKTVNGWKAIDKSKIYITVPGGAPCPFTIWDGNGALFKNVQPFAKKIGDTYFLWIANILPFADDDGQWKSWNCTLGWNKTEGGMGSADMFVDFSESGGRITPNGKDAHTGRGKIYEIDCAIYESFSYTGKGVQYGDIIWNEVDLLTVGIISVNEKAPAETENVGNLVKWLSDLKEESVGVYARKDGDRYYLWMRESETIESLSGCRAQVKRAVFVWKDRNGNLCQQGILFPA